MFYLIDDNHKVIFGWSAKCACSHVKRIFWFLQNNNIENPIHSISGYQKLPEDIDIENYTTIIFIRNPYKRLVSGFLDKYETEGEFRKLWKYEKITFSMFVDELLKKDWHMIEKHHFTPQTTEEFNKKILLSKFFICYDIENINYHFIEQLYNIKIPLEVLHKKDGHERKKYEIIFYKYVYNLDMNDYYCYNVDYKYFFNEELKNKLRIFYEEDFHFFNEIGIYYECPGM